MFKRKKKEDPEFDRAMRNLREKIHALQTERNLGNIPEDFYISQIKPIVDGIDELEIAKDELDEEEFNRAVHRFIDDIFNRREDAED